MSRTTPILLKLVIIVVMLLLALVPVLAMLAIYLVLQHGLFFD